MGRTVAPSLPPGTPGAAFARAAIADVIVELRANADAVAIGADDAESVHRLRVSLRRLRGLIREFAPFDAALDPGWDDPLARAFRGLGVRRDQQVLAAGVAALLADAGGPPLPPLHLDADAPPAATWAQAASFRATLDAIERFTERTGPGDAHDGAARDALADRLDALHRRLRRDARRFGDLPPAAQHRVRKRVKRLRYLVEATSVLFDRPKAAARYLDAMRPAQDALGRHNDRLVAVAAYRHTAAEAPAAWFAVGWLEARLPETVRDAGRALKRAARAKAFWRG